MRTLLVAGLLLVLPHVATAQTPPAFEVASVKRSSVSAGSWIRFLPGGRLSAGSWVKQLIQTAYGVEDYQVVGGPDWLKTDWYEVDATAASHDAGKKEMTLMLKSLLNERFMLRLHEERRDLPVYDLVVDKGGPKLRRLKDEEPPPCRHIPSAICGLTTTTDLATWLKYIVGRPVFDKTGVDGRFELLLDFDIYSTRGQAPPPDYNRPSVFEALKEQFGLRLEPQKTPTPVLVIESIQRPTEN
jgi:uncharacterized protein (TIGR03435 family)